MARAFEALTGKLRRLLGNHLSKRVDRPEKHKRSGKSISFQPTLEQLEERLAPAVDYASMATGLTTQLDNLRGVVKNFANDSTAVLPILGSSLADRATNVESMVLDIRKAIAPVVRSLDGNAGPDAIRTALFKTGVVRDLDSNGVNADDVQISNYDPQNGNVTITIRVGKNIDLTNQNLKFDLGLPGVPFGLTGNSKLSVGLDVDYDSLSFGMKNGAFFVESATGRANTLTVTITGDAKDTNLIGTIGFFQVKGDAMPGLPAARVSAGLVLDANGATLSSPRFVGSAAVNMSLDATIKSNGTGLTFPHMTTDFQMYWDLGGAKIANRNSLGKAPSVAFNNIQFGLGSFLGSMVKPIAETVQKITAPLAPVYELLQTPLPGLNDLSKAAGTGPITLDKLANLAVASKVLPPDYQLLADIGTKLHTIVELLRDANFGSGNNQLDGLIPVGSFNLSGNGDLRQALLNGNFTNLKDWAAAGINNLNLKDITKLVPAATSALESIEHKISTGNLPPEISGVVQDTFKKINETLRKLQNGIGLTFPLLDDPVSIYKLLLGQDVDFARFDAKFEGTASQTVPIKVLDPITAEFTGTINLNAEVHVGVDTFGLRTFFLDIATGKPADPSKLDDGLYVDSSKELVHIDGEIKAKAGIDQAFGAPLQLFAFLGFTGKVATSPEGIVVKFVDPNQRGDHKLRVLKADELGDHFIDVKGSMSANFEFKVEAGVRVVVPDPFDPFGSDIVLFEGRKEIYHKTFVKPDFSFSTIGSIDTSNPFNNPALIDKSIDVIYDVNFMQGANDGRSDTIRAVFTNNNLNLYFNGFKTDTYKLKYVNSLKIIGSDDDEEITVEGLSKPVSVDGGAGYDLLDFDDSASISSATYAIANTGLARFQPKVTFLNYDQVEHLVVTGSSTRNNSFFIGPLSVVTQVFGGDADDRFTLGSSSKTLDGAFIPSLIGGAGFNSLYLDDSDTGWQATYSVGQESLTRSTYESFYSQTLDRTFTYQISYDSLEFFNFDYVELKGTGFGNRFIVDDRPDSRVENPQQIPFSIDLYTGTGDDNVTVYGTTDTLNIFGQDGSDVVTIGGSGIGTRSIYGDINITNAGSFTTLNVDDADDTTNRTILMDTTTAGDRGFITGLTGTALGGFGQSRISYKVSDTEAVNVKAGSGNDSIGVSNTAARGATIVLPTTISTGEGFNSVNVRGTTGDLTIDAAGFTGIVIGSRLNRIKAPVTLRGRATELSITDFGFYAPSGYTMDASHFYRTNPNTGATSGSVYYGQLSTYSFNVSGGNGGNTFTIDGTPTLLQGFNPSPNVVNVFTGTGSDVVKVRGTNGPVSLDLGPGSYQSVEIGDATHSLDAISNGLSVTGSGFIDAFVSNAASTVQQKATITALTTPFGRSQTVKREVWNGDHWDTLNTISFGFNDPSRLSYTAGRQGDEIFVRGTLAKVDTIVTSGAGQDVFHIEGDQVPLLSPVYVMGDRSTLDIAYYDDFNTATPQTYTIDRNNSRHVVSRSGAADVFFSGLMQFIPITAHNGGNQVSVRDIPADLRVDLFVADHDVVTVGRPTPMSGGVVGGTMNRIRGAVAVNGGREVSLVLNDTAATRGRNATLHPADDDGTESITGMGPGVVRWTLDPSSSVDIRGGRFNDTFAIDGVFAPAISIDGGLGTNTLDYSNYVNNNTGPVSWYRGEFDFTDAVGGHNGTGVNGAGFAEAGISGGAFYFDGNDDYVVIPNHSDLPQAALTLEARISPLAVDGNRVIVSKYDDSGSGGINRSWDLSIVDGHVRFGVYQGSAGRVLQTNDSISTDGFWQHVAATFDPSTAVMRIYVDGQEMQCSFVEGFEGEVTAINSSGSPVRIGARVVDGVTGSFWSGRIDDVRIYARTLSQAEVQASYEAGSDTLPAASTPGVRVHLPLGTATGLDGGIARIQNVIGSAFDDILTGNGGNVLSGGAGRDILVAGRSPSTLNGGDGEDVLIGGFLYADDADGELDQGALETIAAEWARRDTDYAARSSTLQAMLAGPFFGNGGLNALYGQGELDLFLANEGDLADWTDEKVHVTV